MSQSIGRALILSAFIFVGRSAFAVDGYCVNTWQSIYHGVFRDRSGSVIRKMPITHGVIVDSNVLNYYVNTKGRRSADIEKILHGIRKIRRIRLKTDGQFRMYVADQTALELGRSNEHRFAFPTETRRIVVSTARDSREYQSVMRTLDGAGVGKTRGATGDADREIVADAIFASTARGDTPTFVTTDRGIIVPLCKLSPPCQKSIALGRLEAENANGFEVEIPVAGGSPRRIHILPLFAR